MASKIVPFYVTTLYQILEMVLVNLTKRTIRHLPNPVPASKLVQKVTHPSCIQKTKSLNLG